MKKKRKKKSNILIIIPSGDILPGPWREKESPTRFLGLGGVYLINTLIFISSSEGEKKKQSWEWGMDISPLTVTEALASKSYEKIAHICDHLLLQVNYSSSFVVVVVVVVRATWYSVNVVWTGCGRGRCLWGRLALLLYSSSRPHLRWWYVCFFFFFFFFWGT